MIAGILLTVIVVFASVVARYFFGTGVGWSEDIVRYMMIWISFLGLGIGIRKGSHITVDFFVEKVFGHNNVKRKYVDRVINMITCFFSFFLFVSSLLLTVYVFQTEQISAGLQIPMWIVYATLPLSTLAAVTRSFMKGLTATGHDEKKYWE